MNMESDELHLFQHAHNSPLQQGFKRPRRSMQSSTTLSTVSEGASPAPNLANFHLTPDVISHINALKHLDDQQIFHLLEAARSRDRNSISTLGSRSSFLSVPSSRVTSTFSDPRSSIASTDTSFSSYSSTSRLSTLSTTSRLPQAPSSAPSSKNFACTFCDKPLKSKPYWKAHEEEFHEQRLTWRCPDCEQIFNAGKRFREHHFKLHGCESCKQPKENGHPTSRKASPCVKKYERVMHDKDAWGCGFCSELLSTWEERCEHIAAHFEDKASKWNFTNVILGLLKQTDVAQSWRMLITEKYGDEQNWPQFTWDSKKTHRLRYKLETKWNTQAFDVTKLVRETFELASIEVVVTKAEVVITKVEEVDFADDQSMHHLPSSSSSHEVQELPMAMDLDPIGSTQAMQQPQWAVPDIPHTDMTTSNTLSTYSFTDDFSQQVTQSFHQPTWPSTGFLPSNDLLPFQQADSYMNYIPKVEYEPTFPTRSSAPMSASPSSFSHMSETPPVSSSSNSRRWVPKLVQIPSHRESTHQSQSQSHSHHHQHQHQHHMGQDQAPPPPPPKDDQSQSHRFSSKPLVRRKPSNMSMAQSGTAVHHWHDEFNWG